MPRIQPTESRRLLVIDIADYVDGQTVIKRRATYTGFAEELSATGESHLTITVQVTHYAAAPDGEHGPLLTMPGLSGYQHTLYGRNDTLCDYRLGEPTLGEILHIFNSWDTPEQQQAVVESYPFDTILQGDYFAWLRETQAVPIGPMLRQHIAAAFTETAARRASPA